MDIVYFFGILLIMVLISNVINKLLPSLSVPLIQMTLGILVALMPDQLVAMNFVLDPELFFLLFLAPLIYYEGTMLDTKAMLEVKWPILSSAVALVIVTVITAGFFLSWLFPSIPLVVAFVLIGALAPTDSVSVMAVAKRVPVSRKLMNILAGESVMNDASGITMFQLALAAAATGVFSVTAATVQFSVLWAGGIVTGIVVVLAKYWVIKRLRNLGAENVTFRVLIRIMTPFFVFLIAESISVSGILAVLSAGITHSMVHNRFDPRMSNFHTANKSVWATLAFTLEGLVFLMLGTQLPAIMQTLTRYGYGDLQSAILAIISLTLFFAVTRFIWWVTTVKLADYQETDQVVNRYRAGIIFSLAGARGTVTLASVFSIPALLMNGEMFPERELVIAIATGIIIISMMITNFILPLFVVAPSAESEEEREKQVYRDIIQKVMDRLEHESDADNHVATAVVIKNLSHRLSAYHVQDRRTRRSKNQDEYLFRESFFWQREYVQKQMEGGNVAKEIGVYYLDALERIDEVRFLKQGFLKRMRFMFTRRRILSNPPDQEVFNQLRTATIAHVIKRLTRIKTPENATSINRLITFYTVSGVKESKMVLEITANAFQIERELLQEAFDQDEISWVAKREMLRNIMILEDELTIQMN